MGRKKSLSAGNFDHVPTFFVYRRSETLGTGRSQTCLRFRRVITGWPRHLAVIESHRELKLAVNCPLSVLIYYRTADRLRVFYLANCLDDELGGNRGVNRHAT